MDRSRWRERNVINNLVILTAVTGTGYLFACRTDSAATDCRWAPTAARIKYECCWGRFNTWSNRDIYLKRHSRIGPTLIISVRSQFKFGGRDYSYLTLSPQGKSSIQTASYLFHGPPQRMGKKKVRYKTLLSLQMDS